MNSRCYRLVFNRLRGLLMAVAETARSHRACGSGSQCIAGGAVMGLLVGLLLPAPAGAQILPDPIAPRERQPIVHTAPNGVPLVQIQTPNGAGVSRNAYRQFDVQRDGAILNNATKPVPTALGGWVQANPLLNRPASVIVNEVNASDPSLLRGPIEIAGQRAQLIVANPSGIYCDGCGFLNAHRATLTTGAPQYEVSGHLDSYLVRGGTVSVTGDGLDARSADFTDVIARAVQVNAALHAQQLNVIAGSHTVDAVSGQASAVAGSDTRPDFAIDVGALGGMYARKIWLVGTEAGVGVRMAGTVSTGGTGTPIGSAESLRVTAAGRLEITGLLSSADALAVHAAAGLTQHGVLHAQEDLTMQVAGDLDNHGELAANRSVSVTTSGTVTNHAAISAGESLSVTAAQVHNDADGRLVAPRVAIHATAPHALVNRGLIDGGEVRLTSPTIKNLDTGRIYGDHVRLAADIVRNEAGAGVAADPPGAADAADAANTPAATPAAAPVIAARQRLDIAADQIANREGALLYSESDLAIGRQLDAQGQLSVPARLLENTSATIDAQGDIDIAADEIRNTNAHFSTRTDTRPTDTLIELAGAGSPRRYRPDDPDVYVYKRESDHLHTPERNYDRWQRYVYQRSVIEEVTASSSPAQILAGGDVRVRGQTLTNDKSRILAGADLDVQVATLNNIDATGTRMTRDRGTVTSFWRDHEKGRDSTGVRRAAYEPPPVVQTISLGVLAYRDQTPPGPSGIVSVGGGPGAGLSIRTVSLAATVPEGSLYRPAPAARGYLVETDPRFTNYRQWLASDYLLQRLALDPQQMQQRLGDGFDEQRRVREQVAQLTGRRFLPGYASDEAQFQALMDNGASFAQAQQLRPGVALSAEQMAALTSDIVWLVEQDVTLPDGQVTRALVPQVYVQVREGDLQPDGTLLGGEQVRLTLTGELNNAGTVAGRQLVHLTAANVANLGGTIAGGRVNVQATNDIDSTGGQLRADQALVLTAGRDITVASSTRSQTTAQGSRTNVDRVAGLYVSGDDGELIVVAGQDLRLKGAEIAQGRPAVTGGTASATATATANATATATTAATATTTATSDTTSAPVPATGRTVLAAGRDLQFDTVAETRSERIDWGGGNHRSEASRTDAATTITANGAVDLNAGRDIVAHGAQVVTRDAGISVNAGRDAVLTTAESQASVDESHRHTRSGMASSTTYRYRDTLEQTTRQGTLLSGEQVNVQAGQDLRVDGSQVVSSAGTTLDAGRHVTIEAATDTRHETHHSQKKTSGVMGSGGFGVTVGTRRLKTDTDSTSTTAVASTVGSTEGQVRISAGESVRQAGSAVLAPNGDVTIAGGQIDIVEARHTETLVSGVQFRQSGVTVAVSNPVIAAVQTAQQMHAAASNTNDSQMKTLAAANTALAAAHAYDAVQAGQGSILNGQPNQIRTGTDASGQPTSREATAADKLGGLRIAVSVGSMKSDSRTVVTRSDAVASTVRAGGDVTITAVGSRPLGDGQQSERQQSDGQQTAPQQTDRPPRDITVQGSQITAGGRVTLAAEQALNLQAAATTQTQTSGSRNTSASVGVVMDTRGGVGVNVSGSVGRGQADGRDLAWRNAKVAAGQQVTLQSGADTAIRGAVVSAPQVTVASGGELRVESPQDRSTHQSSQQQVGGSVTLGAAPSVNVNYANGKIDSTYTSVVEPSGIRAGDGGFAVTVAGNTQLTGGAITSTQAAVDAQRNTFQTGGTVHTTDIENRARYHAESVSVNVGTGFSAQGGQVPAGTSVGFGNDHDQMSSSTRSGISGIAGDTTLRTGDKSTGIAKIFDADTVQKDVTAQTQITQTFSSLAPAQVAAYAGGKVREINEQLGREADPERRAALLAERQRWEEGGAYRVMLHTAAGGLAGDVSGAAGAGAAAVAAPAVNALQVTLEKSLVAAGMTPTIAKGVAANVSGLAAAGAGATVGGATGAGVALSVDANNRQLHPEETKWIKANARRFAQQQGISEPEAERRLAEQAFRQVQFVASGTDDAQARAFLSQANGLLAPDHNCPSCGPGYMFYATPDQRANLGMYATQVVSDPKALEFYGKNAIAQPTPQQIQLSARKDANVRSTIANATMSAAGVATTLTAPPALSWCLANPVACNRIVITGGEIAAGDAMGPVGLGVVGTASAVKAVRSADEVNAAMKAQGWEPAWSSGTPVIEGVIQYGTKVRIIVDERSASSITKAIQSSGFSSVHFGGWATFDEVESVAVDMRQSAAITNKFKPASTGPFYVVDLEIKKPLHANIGFAGAQRDNATSLRGGATQIEFLIPSSERRADYLVPISFPRKLGGF